MNKRCQEILQELENEGKIKIWKGVNFPEGTKCDNKIIEHNPNGKHQQDLIQDEQGLCRCIPGGTHGSTPHLLKTVVREFDFPEPQELKLKLKDLLEPEVDEKYYLSDKLIAGLIKHSEQHKEKGHGFKFQTTEGEGVASSITTRVGACRTGDNYIKQVGELDIKGHDCVKRVYSSEGISPTLTNMQGGNRQPKIIETATAAAQRGRYDKSGEVEQQLELSDREYANTLTTVQKDSMACLKIKNATKQGYLEAQDGNGVYISAIDKKRGTVQKDKIQTIKTSPDVGVVVGKEKLRIRKLTPRECWRLMGFSDEDFDKAKSVPTSDTQLYKEAR